MNRAEFKKLSPEDQWQWVFENRDQVELITLDNDSTYVKSPLFLEPGDEDEENNEAPMKSWLGNGPGVYDLLSAIGISSESV
jgi:hypothetical protein